MKRCRSCKVPLEGIGAKIANKLFKVSSSSNDPDLCNKCEDKTVNKTSRQYICQVCNRKIDEEVALTHIKAEEYIINLIKKDHPEWNKDKGACKECVEYYKKLIKEAEI